ncbi:ATP-dependent DNA helicase [Microbacterium sp. X-17]|uniref:ATP-dependent DNA helicase n=1 Tax=Microbacterium sp. X-17 TaxID=3144404 RepID=UPI0031F4BB64
MSGIRLSASEIAEALGQFPPTAEQTAVIEAPLEPALVVAGAGSGKTETMAGRVVWLVANGLVRREEVLGLTFTRKAAGELTERIGRRLAVLDRLGLAADAADGNDLLERATVATYNSFADQIVREHAVRIARDPDAAVLSDSAAWLLMRRVVLGSDDPRLEERPEAVRTIVDAALRIAQDAADHRVDLDRLGRFADEFARVAELPSENKRTTVYADVVKAVADTGALPLLARLAEEYRDRKRRAGVLDFSDQVAGALELVTRHPDVAAELRGRYRVVLLDEYQDTSVLQTELLSTLFADAAVMAVGDPHQAIYGWRGASAGNLGGFARAFAPAGDARRFALSASWRNSRRVLEAAAGVVAALPAAVPVDALRPRPDAPAGEVAIVEEVDVDAEADRVAAWFDGVRAARARADRPTTGAILFRSKKHMVRYGEALGRRGIPHRILGLGGLLSTPEVADVVCALRVVSDPHAGSALIRLLGGPRWGIGLPDLRALADLARRIEEDAAPEGERIEQASLVDALDAMLRLPDEHGWLRALTPAARTRLREAAGVFAGLRRAAALPIPELVRVIELELRLDVELAANETRGPARVAVAQLRAFVDEVHAFLATDEAGTLPSLLAWLDHAERLDELAPRTEPAEDDVVQLLTIHGSKGLEWDAVAVVRLVEDELPTAPRDTRGWLGFGVLPYAFRGDAAWLPDLAWEGAASQQELKAAFDDFVAANKDRQRDEDRRLAYVAVTRARDHLCLSGAPWSGTKRPRERSAFLREIAEALGIALPAQEPGENPYAGVRRTMSWPLDPLGERRVRVERAAERASAALAEPRAQPEEDLELLLAERAAQLAGRTPSPRLRVAASRYRELTAVEADSVVLPERPHRRTRIGTSFHEWVERRSGLAGTVRALDDGLWDRDETWAEADAEGIPEDEVAAGLRTAFERSEWGALRPLEVETQIDMPVTGDDGIRRIVVCKLDAVYRRADRGDRIEIVDWKTGSPPASEAERAERMLQLGLYRQAYHLKHGIPLDEIDVALFYVAHDLVIRA